MSKLADAIVYLCQRYPHKHELSKARLTKLVYLADWMSAQKLGKQITAIQWYFHNYGPYVEDVFDEAKRDPRVRVNETTTIYGAPKALLCLEADAKPSKSLDHKETDILDAVISDTKTLFWDGFIKHVYATYPVRISDRYQPLDLVSLAHDEKSVITDVVTS